MAPLSAQTAQAATNAYKKNVYNAGTSTPASTVTAGSQVTYVVDLGAAAGNAEPTGTTTSLNDLLSAGHSGITAPDLPDGWSSPVTAVAGTNTTIGTWDVAANAAPIATFDNDVTAKPLMGSNAYAAGMTLYPKTTTLAGAGLGDGFAPFAYTTGTGKRQVLAINHHATGPSVPCLDYPSWASCYGTNTPLRLTDPGPTSGTGIATMPYSPNTIYYAKIGNRIYSPAMLGKYAGAWTYTDMLLTCVDVSLDVPAECPTIDLPQTVRDATTVRGVTAIGNYIYVSGGAPVAEGGGWRWWATDVTTGITTVTTFANPNLYGGFAKDRHNVFMNPDRYATVTDDGKVVCVDFNGPAVTNCDDGSTTLKTYPSTGAATDASVFPIVAGGAVDYPIETGVCSVAGAVQNCYDYNMVLLPDRNFAPDPTTPITQVSNSYGTPVPNSTDYVTPAMMWYSATTLAYGCFDTSDTSATVSGGCGYIGNYSYGVDFVTDTCLVSYDDPNIWRFYTYNKDYSVATAWTTGCATPQAANGTQVTIPDPKIQHCGPGTSVISWDKTTLTNVPAFTGPATLQYYKADGITLIDSTTFTNSTAAATLAIPIPSTVKYATDPSIKVQIVWPETLTVTANTVVGIKVSHITSDGSGPQVCFAATLPPTCPAAATSLNTASIVGSTLLAVNAASVPVTTSMGGSVACAAPVPRVGLTKAASPTVISGVGQTVTYTFVATNTGTATLTNVSIADTMTLAGGTLSSISCASLAGPAGPCTGASSTSLAVGQSATFTATYVTTDVDITNGKITNSAIANASSIAGPASSAPATAQVDVVKLVHKKAASPAVVTAVGQTVTYTFEVFNGGSMALTGVAITDTLTQAGNPAGLSAITCSMVTAPGSCSGPTTADLAAGGTATFTATYVTTPQDLDNGTITNTATATGNPPTGGPLTSNLAQATVSVGRLSIAKSASPVVINAVGDNVTYSFLVTNTGTTPMTNVSVSDTFTTVGDPAGLSPIACMGLTAPAGSCSGSMVATLAVGQSATFKATYLAVAADLTNKSVVNEATATGTPEGTTTPVTTSPTTATVNVAAITLVKSAMPATFNQAPTVLTYSFLVTNTGSVTLNPVVVSDPLPNLSPIDCAGISSLAAGSSMTCSATYSATAADLLAGSINNTATVTGTPPSGPAVTAASTASVPVSPQFPAISLVKSASPATFSAPNTVITYSYVVSNIGDIRLDPIAVTDSMEGLSALSCPATALSPTDPPMTCTATYTTTQGDVDTGRLYNQGIATGKTLAGGMVQDTSEVIVPATQTPDISVVKTASVGSFVVVGAEITYSYLVKNTGNVKLKDIVVTDPMPGLSPVSCPITDIADGATDILVGGEITCTATYITTADDVANGSINNTATATGTSGTGAVVTDTSAVSIPVASYTVSKAASAASAVPGSTVTYTVTVTNTGGIAFTGATFDDDLSAVLDDASYNNDAVASVGSVSLAGSTLSWSGDLVYPSVPVTVTYSVTVNSPDEGDHKLTNAASPTTPGGFCSDGSAPVENLCAAVIVPVTSFTVAKTASATSAVPGAKVTYTVTVTNTGGAAFTGASFSDALAGVLDDATYNADAVASAGSVSLAGSTLSWSGDLVYPSVPVTITYSVTVNSPDTGDHVLTNAAVPTELGGFCSDGSAPVDELCAAVVVPVTTYAVSKSASASSAVPGAKVTYTVAVTNTGGSAYTGATFSDALAGVLDDATYNNDAVASSGSVSLSGSTLSWTGDLVYPAVPVTITYSVTVNSPDTGDHVLTNAAVPTGPGGFCSDGSAPVDGLCAAVLVPVTTYAVSKAASASSVVPGGTVTYTITVTNTGGGAFTGATFTDNLAGVLDDAVYNADAVASAGSVSVSGSTLSWTGDLVHPSVPVTITYSVTVNSPDTGDHSLTNAAVPTAPGGYCADGSAPVADLCPAVVVPVLTYTVSKAASATSAVPGDTVTYTVTVTNTGGAALTGATFSDDLSGVLDDATYNSDAVASSGSVSLTGSTLSWSGDLVHPSVPVTITYSVTVSSPDAGDHALTNAAAPTVPGGLCSDGSAPVDDLCPAVIVPVRSFMVAKAASVSTTVPGATVTYTLTVTNTGGAAFTGATFSDELSGVLDDATYNSDAVASSGSVTLTGSTLTWSGDLAYPSVPVTVTYSVTVNTPDVGDHALINAAVPTIPGGFCSDGSEPVDDLCPPGNVPVTSYTVSKSASATSAVPGDTVTYTVTVTNTGGAALTGATFSDDLSGVLDDGTYNSDAVASSGSVSMSGSILSWSGDLSYPSVPAMITYSVTVSTPDTGDHALINAAVPTTAGGLCFDGTAPVDGLCPAVIVPVASFTVSKAASVASAVPGSTVTYTVTVTNTGGAVFTGATFDDDLSAVLDDASYNNDAVASVGSVSLAGSTLSWSGDLVYPSVPVTVTYSVTVNSPDEGDHKLTNAANPTVPGGFCADGSAPVAGACPAAVVPVVSYTVAKAASVSSAVPGAKVTYTVTVTNTGGSTFTGATFSDALAGVLDDATYNADAVTSSGSVSVTGSDLSWTGDLVYPSVPVTITYSVTVSSPDTGDHVLTNAAVPTGPGGFCSDGSAPVDGLCAAVLVPVTTYTVSKSASASSAVPGAKVTYTVTVTNTGGSAYTGATFSDALAGVLDDATYNNDAVASAGSVSVTGSDLSWSGDLVYPSVPVTITYSVTVNSPDSGDHVLTNAAVPTGPGGLCSDGSALVDGLCAAVVVPVTTYTVSKSASVASAVPGSKVTYTVTVTNTGGAPFTGATFTDDLAGVLDDAAYNSDAVASSGSVSVTGSTLSWSGDLAFPTVPVTITYSVTVNTPDSGDHALTNAAVPTVPGGLCSDGTAPVGGLCPAVIVPVRSFTVSKAASVSSAVPGSKVTYTVTVTNTGGAAFAGAAFTDDLSGVLDDATYNADAVASAGSVSVTGSDLSWSGDLVYPSVPVTITYSVTVNSPDTGDHVLTNAAVPTGPGGLCSDGTAPVDELCAAVLVPVTTYTVSKAASATSAVPGAKVTYTVTVTNTGGSAYTGATFSDALAGVLDDATYNNDAVASSGSVSLSGSTLSWSGDLVYPAVPVTITYSVTVNSPDTGDHVLTNAAVPTGPGGFCSDGTAPVDGLCAAVIVPVRSFTVSKAASVSSAVPGSKLTYTVTVTNTGGAAFTGATLTDDLAGVLDDATYNADAVASSGSVSVTGSTLSWSGDLAYPSVPVTITYSVTANSPITGDHVLTNAAVPTAPGGLCSDGSAPLDDTCPAVLVPVTAYTVSKAASLTSAVTGSTVTYTVTVANTGRAAFAGASFTDDLSGVLDDATYNTDAMASAGSVALIGSTLSWSGDLAYPSVPVTITYSVTVNAPDQGDHQLINAAVPTTAGGFCGDGSATQDGLCPAVVVPVQSFTVAKAASTPSAVTGSTVTYTVTVTNTGGTGFVGAMVTDDLSGVLDDAVYNTDAVASSGSVSVTGSTLSWSGDLAYPSVPVTINYSVTVKAPDTADLLLSNAAVPTVPGGSCANATLIAPDACPPIVVPVTSFTVSKAASASTAVLGSRVTYTVTVTNTGKAAFTGAAFSDDLTSVLDDATYNDDAVASSGTVSRSGSALSWTGDLAYPSVPVTVTYSVTVKNPDPGDSRLTNAAVPSVPGGFCSDGSAPVAGACPAVVVPVTSFTVSKAASTASVVPAGAVTYTITVTNTGRAAFPGAAFIDDLSGVLDDATYNTDAMASSGSVSVSGSILSWSGDLAFPSVPVTITYSVTVNSPDTGDHSLSNAAVPTVPGGLCSDGYPPVGDTCVAVVVPVMAYAVSKTASESSTVPGATVTYTVTVTNTGGAAFTSASLRDDLSGVLDDATYNTDAVASSGTVSLIGSTLSWSGDLAYPAVPVTITYSVTVKAPPSGDLTMTNVAIPTAPGGSCTQTTLFWSLQAPDACPPVIIPVQSLTVVKSASPTTITHVGEQVTYTFLVTNVGTEPMTNVSVSDAFTLVGNPTGLSSITCGALTSPDAPCSGTTLATLDAGQSATFQATYTAVAADISNGMVTNAATATGTPLGLTSSVTSPISEAAVSVAQITLIKSASPTTFSAVGARVTYSFLVSNTGTVPLTSITVTDPLANLSAIDCSGVTQLGVGGSITCTATYTTTQTDLDAGHVYNKGTVTGSTSTGATVSDTSEVTVSATQNPNITVEKSTTTGAFAGPGSVVTFSYLVRNTGNVSLQGVSVVDPMPGLSPLSCPTTQLAVGESMTCTATYTTTQNDVKNGLIDSEAIASGTPPTGPPVTARDNEPVPAELFTVSKAASVSSALPGTQVTYTIKVANTGRVGFEGASFTDDLSAVLDDASYNADAVASAGTVSVSGSILSWSGDLAYPPLPVTITYSVTVKDPATGDRRMTNAAVPTVPGGLCADGTPPVANQCAPVLVTVPQAPVPIPSLSRTGIEVATWVGFALALLALGSAGLWLSARRRQGGAR